MNIPKNQQKKKNHKNCIIKRHSIHIYHSRDIHFMWNIIKVYEVETNKINTKKHFFFNKIRFSVLVLHWSKNTAIYNNFCVKITVQYELVFFQFLNIRFSGENENNLYENFLLLGGGSGIISRQTIGFWCIIYYFTIEAQYDVLAHTVW